MKDKFYQSINLSSDPEKWPAILTAKHLGIILGYHKNGVYELFKRSGFPSVFLGRKIVVPRDAFLQWLQNEAAKPPDEKISQ